MQTLINSLLNGTNEYRDNGVVVVHPPTATSLRAARELTALTNINTTNQHLIMQLQARVDEQLKELLTLQSHNNELQSNLQKLQPSNVQPNPVEHTDNPNANVQDVREDQGQTGDVECTSEQPAGSDSDSEGRGTN